MAEMTLMKIICCWIFILLSASVSASSAAGLGSSTHGSEADTSCNSKLQEKKYHQSPVQKQLNSNEELNLADYRPYDPSPNSRPTIHSGPIYHNTPLNPHIPKSPPHSNRRKQSPAPIRV